MLQSTLLQMWKVRLPHVHELCTVSLNASAGEMTHMQGASKGE